MSDISQRPREVHLFKWVDEAVTDEITRIGCKHDDLAKNVTHLRNTYEAQTGVQETTIVNNEEVIQPTVINEDFIKTYEMLWFYGNVYSH
ncbi:unnamed protein product [Eruca vesicaria subsp. sativa]|uniref:Uncharacterized protein n=1 Tax=Eruca vesicaria subsp. sativa TaxID=29727 RepID=A0ABC8KI62_ERUVS|nr:unnamed protein product [Eruca vesicaria subsp. sativa]